MNGRVNTKCDQLEFVDLNRMKLTPLNSNKLDDNSDNYINKDNNNKNDNNNDSKNVQNNNNDDNDNNRSNVRMDVPQITIPILRVKPMPSHNVGISVLEFFSGIG